MLRITILSVLSLLLIQCSKKGESIESKQLSTSDNEIINYVEYCNERYDMCFDYPSNFSAQPVPLNGDGRTFINKPDSAEIVMYGFIDETGSELNNQLEVLGDMLKDEKITKLDNGYEITGILLDNGFVYHEKLLVRNGENNLQTVSGLQFTHPKSKTQKFSGYWKSMIEKFK
ncbi:MAG: hypothetical protein ACR2MS_10355 [Weeksellaceae bacterium]